MLNVLKKTTKQTFIYSIGNLLIKLGGLILIPLFTTNLGTVFYGHLAIFDTSAQILNFFFTLYLHQAIIRWLPENTYNPKKVVSTAFFSMCFFSAFASFVLFFLTKPIALNFFKSADYTKIIFLFLIYLNFEIINFFGLSLLRALEKSIFYISIQTIKLVFYIIFNFLFLSKFNYGLWGVMLSYFLSSFIATIIQISNIFKFLSFQFDKQLLKSMLKYSIPLGFSSLATVFLDSADRYLLKLLAGDSYVGIYSLAYRISGLLNFFILGSFMLSFLPIAFNISKDSDAPEVFSKITTLLSFVLISLGLALAIFSKEFLMIFSPKNKEFWQAAKFVPFINIIVILFGLRFMLNINFLIAKKNIYQLYFVSAAVVLNVLLNYLLIPKYKIYGAVITSIFCSLILNISYYFMSKKFYKVNYQFTKIFLTFVIATVFYIISVNQNLSFWWALVTKSFWLLAYFAIIYIFLITNEEKNTLKKLYLTYIKPKLV